MQYNTMPEQRTIPNAQTVEGASPYAEAEARLISLVAMLEQMDEGGVTFMPVEALKLVGKDIDTILKALASPRMMGI